MSSFSSSSPSVNGSNNNNSFYYQQKSVKPFIPSSKLKGIFVGSGSDGLNEKEIVESILNLVDDDKKSDDGNKINVLYIGTATYDLSGPANRQTQRFIEYGCNVKQLNLVVQDDDEEKIIPPSSEEIKDLILNFADIIIVSGGNTLFAVDMWVKLGIDKMLREAMERGIVLTGGSAGAICWFQGGHSDSDDPDTYKTTMLKQAAKAKVSDSNDNQDESSNAPTNPDDVKSWEYIRINGLSFIPGLVCPHHDKVQSNGVLRSDDFDKMLLRHPTEIGICIDHYAALQIVGETYKVISLDNKEGSVLLPLKIFSRERKGIPGIWIKYVDVNESNSDDKAPTVPVVRSKLCPSSGNINDIIPHWPTNIIQDDRIDLCRKKNPIS